MSISDYLNQPILVFMSKITIFLIHVDLQLTAAKQLELQAPNFYKTSTHFFDHSKIKIMLASEYFKVTNFKCYVKNDDFLG